MLQAINPDYPCIEGQFDHQRTRQRFRAGRSNEQVLLTQATWLCKDRGPFQQPPGLHYTLFSNFSLYNHVLETITSDETIPEHNLWDRGQWISHSIFLIHEHT